MNSTLNLTLNIVRNGRIGCRRHHRYRNGEGVVNRCENVHNISNLIQVKTNNEVNKFINVAYTNIQSMRNIIFSNKRIYF